MIIYRRPCEIDGSIWRLKAEKTSLYLNLSVVIIVSALIFSGSSVAETIPLMAKENHRTLLGDDHLAILDVRAGRDWKNSEFQIKGAERVEPEVNIEWADKFKRDKTYAFYCA